MTYMYTYSSPLGNIFLAADEVGLTGLRFEGQKYFANTLPGESISQETPILNEAKRWLDIYFSGKEPTFTPLLQLVLHSDRLCGRYYCRFHMEKQ